MKEWNNQLNPFNSMKVLMWREQLEGCAKDNYLPPVTVDIDPSNRCNYDCIWCNAYDMMCKNKDHTDMSEEHMLKIADMLKEWRTDTGLGPASACIAGGGEPLLNEGTIGLLERMHKNNLQCGVITNGSLINEEKAKIIAKTCRWVGFSMDAASAKTYNTVKGIKGNLFDKVIENIKLVSKHTTGSTCDLAYKYLLHPWNAHEIYDAAVLAKSIGCRDFHLRPVGWLNITKIEGENQLDWNDVAEMIEKQVAKALELEDENFHFYGIRHKFNQNFSPRKNFSRCWAIPLLPTFGADGWVHTCFDMRGREDLKLCRHDPDPWELVRFWNSENHKEVIRNIDVNTCPRCTFSLYNEIVEKVFIEDRMCRLFP